jgi:phosphomannomutase
MAYEQKSLVDLQKGLYDFVGCKFYNDRIDKHLENTEEIKPVLEKFREMSSVGNYKIIKTDLKDGVKLYLDDNSSWILVRPSGTEPLLRIYFESDSEEKIEKLKNFI